MHVSEFVDCIKQDTENKDQPSTSTALQDSEKQITYS